MLALGLVGPRAETSRCVSLSQRVTTKCSDSMGKYSHRHKEPYQDPDRVLAHFVVRRDEGVPLGYD